MAILSGVSWRTVGETYADVAWTCVKDAAPIMARRALREIIIRLATHEDASGWRANWPRRNCNKTQRNNRRDEKNLLRNPANEECGQQPGEAVRSYEELNQVTGDYVVQQVALKADHLVVQIRAKAQYDELEPRSQWATQKEKLNSWWAARTRMGLPATTLDSQIRTLNINKDLFK